MPDWLPLDNKPLVLFLYISLAALLQHSLSGLLLSFCLWRQPALQKQDSEPRGPRGAVRLGMAQGWGRSRQWEWENCVYFIFYAWLARLAGIWQQREGGRSKTLSGQARGSRPVECVCVCVSVETVCEQMSPRKHKMERCRGCGCMLSAWIRTTLCWVH